MSRTAASSRSRGIVVHTHLPLSKIGMTEEQAKAWAAELNEELEGTAYSRAIVTVDGALALDPRLMEKFVNNCATAIAEELA
jgi:hypothetical protein